MLIRSLFAETVRSFIPPQQINLDSDIISRCIASKSQGQFMKRVKKPVQIELDIDEWWSLSRYAARQKTSLRAVAKEHLMPLIKEAMKNFPRVPGQPPKN